MSISVNTRFNPLTKRDTSGPDPIAAMQPDGRKDLVLTMHTVTDVIDGGEFVARSHRVAIPEDVNAIQMHRITWP